MNLSIKDELKVISILQILESEISDLVIAESSRNRNVNNEISNRLSCAKKRKEFLIKQITIFKDLYKISE